MSFKGTRQYRARILSEQLTASYSNTLTWQRASLSWWLEYKERLFWVVADPSQFRSKGKNINGKRCHAVGLYHSIHMGFIVECSTSSTLSGVNLLHSLGGQFGAKRRKCFLAGPPNISILGGQLYINESETDFKVQTPDSVKQSTWEKTKRGRS